MRGIATFLAGFLLLSAGGCAWMDWFSQTADETRSSELLQEVTPLDLALPYHLPAATTSPGFAVPAGGPPPESSRGGEPWPLTLPEAVRIGLMNSQVVRVMDGGDVGASGSTAFDPAIAEAQARAALAAFDPRLDATGYANWIDQPPDSFFGPGLSIPNQRNQGGASFALVKPWLTGTRTRVGYNSLDFLYIPGYTGSLNPSNGTSLDFGVRQPLLQGAGIAVNKAPIRIAKLRSEQTSLELQQQVMAAIRSINEAYWNLYAARVSQTALEEILPRMEEVVRIEQERFKAQRSVRADVAKARSQLHLLRQQRERALSEVAAGELRLRNLLGIAPADGRSIVPATEPMKAPLRVDPQGSLATALARRPDLIRQRLNVRRRELELAVARNGLWPQLDLDGSYRVGGLGENLHDATNQMTTWNYTDWQTGVTFSVPLGRRAATSNARAAMFQLARERAMMRQTIHAAAHDLSDLARQIQYTQRQQKEAELRLRDAREWLRGAHVRYQFPPPAGDQQDWLLLALNDYLQALRTQADAATEAAFLLAQYDTLLVRWEESLGTLLAASDVHLMSDCGVLQPVLPALSSGMMLPEQAPAEQILPAEQVVPAEQILSPEPIPAPQPTGLRRLPATGRAL